MKFPRVLWIRLHLWMGLVLGAIWMVQAITGASLIFSRDIAAINALGPASSAYIAPESVIPAALATLDVPVERVTLVGADPRLLEFQYRDAQGQREALRYNVVQRKAIALINLDQRRLDEPGGFIDFLYKVHTSLMLGETGKIFIGVSGLYLLLSALIGIYLAWPRWGFADIFKMHRWKGASQKLYGWHRMLGLLICVPLCLIAATGVYIVFTSDRLPLAVAPRALSTASPAHIVDVAQVLQIGAAYFPHASFMAMEMPRAGRPYYRLRYTSAAEWRRWAGRSSLVVDARDGQILALYDPARASLGDQLEDAIYPTHTGESGGLLGRIVALVTGFGLVGLIATGTYRYVVRKHKARK